MKKRMLFAALCLGLCLALCACGGKQEKKAVAYKDGTYTGQSEVYEGDEEGNGDGYGVATLTIEGGRIVACEFVTYETDGTLKDEEYGKAGGQIANKDYYNKAQKAVAACPVYAALLVEAGSLHGVDVISGATYNYQEFKDAVRAALSSAQE